jgi:hypothetical protein
MMNMAMRPLIAAAKYFVVSWLIRVLSSIPAGGPPPNPFGAPPGVPFDAPPGEPIGAPLGKAFGDMVEWEAIVVDWRAVAPLWSTQVTGL